MRLTKEQVRKNLTPPIIYIDEKKSEIDVRKENFLFCSTGIEGKAYKGTVIVDSQGQFFKIKNVVPVGGIKFWTSIKYFSPVKEVLPEVEENIRNLSLEEFKELIVHTISRNPRAWSSLDTIENIKAEIHYCQTDVQVMAIFNKRI
jgi:hypothetical protein